VIVPPGYSPLSASREEEILFTVEESGALDPSSPGTELEDTSGPDSPAVMMSPTITDWTRSPDRMGRLVTYTKRHRHARGGRRQPEEASASTPLRGLDAFMHQAAGTTEVQFGLPGWNAAAHTRNCHTFNPEVGQTNGEGIERTWAAAVRSSGRLTRQKTQGSGKDDTAWKMRLRHELVAHSLRK
jgi:hypothetical protein